MLGNAMVGSAGKLGIVMPILGLKLKLNVGSLSVIPILGSVMLGRLGKLGIAIPNFGLKLKLNDGKEQALLKL